MPDLNQNPTQIAAIVLAAGNSRRFGSDKLLHPVRLQGLTLHLAAHSLVPWLDTFERITVVVRPGSEAFCSTVAAALGARRSAALHWVECANAKRGMAVSLACGVRANPEAAGWLIGLADMPAVPSAAIAGVRNALLSGADLAAPACHGRRGHPVGFASRYCEELLALEGDTGARRLLERDASRLVNIQTDHEGILADIDIPSDLQNDDVIATCEQLDQI